MKTKRPFFGSFGWVALLGLAILAQLLIGCCRTRGIGHIAWSFNYTVDPACSTT